MEIDRSKYNEVPIRQIEINGKKVEGYKIPAEMTENVTKMYVKIFTDEVQKKENS